MSRRAKRGRSKRSAGADARRRERGIERARLPSSSSFPFPFPLLIPVPSFERMPNDNLDDFLDSAMDLYLEEFGSAGYELDDFMDYVLSRLLRKQRGKVGMMKDLRSWYSERAKKCRMTAIIDLKADDT